MTDKCRVSQDELNHDLDQMKRDKFAKSPEQIAQTFIDDGMVGQDIVLEAIADISKEANIQQDSERICSNLSSPYHLISRKYRVYFH